MNLLALAFTAGMLAPVNPCGFALLPAWITGTIATGEATIDEVGWEIFRLILDVASGRTVWSGVGARSGWSRDALSAVAQRLLKSLLEPAVQR